MSALPARLGRKDLIMGCLIFFLILAIGQNYLLPSSWGRNTHYTGSRRMDGVHVSHNHDQHKRDYDFDIVVSYYNEDINILAETVSTVKQKLSSGSKRVIIYFKGDHQSTEGRVRQQELLEIADEVIPLPNIGREGATYLSHITRHYPSGHVDFAEHTLFLQPHLAWDWVIKPRLSVTSSRTGFMSYGPYINMTEGKDVNGNVFPRINDIYDIFRQEFHPPTTVLATWAGQFVVSRQRILDNSMKSYENLLGMFTADKDHWIWKEGWWNNQPSDPTLGHALERSWPIIFGCSDATIAQTCGEGHGSTCQCLDPLSTS